MSLGQTREEGNRVLTLPNAITLFRLLLIPIFLFVAWDRHRLILAGLLLGFIGATDWVDGYLARRLNQTSTVGKVIDPSADRLLLIAAGVVTLHQSLMPAWLLVMIFAREIAVASVVGAVAIRFKQRLDVVYYGKAGTLLMMFGFPFFVFAGANTSFSIGFRVIGYVFLLPGLAVLFLALGSYSRKLIGFIAARER